MKGPKMNIYLASSWRNAHQPIVLAALRAAGHEVYDFRNPAPDNDGFRWSDIDPNWQQWTPEQYHAALNHPIANRGFRYDMDALSQCDACVLVLPCGRSAHLELGWAAGAGKLTIVLQLEPQEPELMVKMCDGIASSVEGVLALLEKEPLCGAVCPADKLACVRPNGHDGSHKDKLHRTWAQWR